jgi:DNA-binding response OmpR family regulator
MLMDPSVQSAALTKRHRVFILEDDPLISMDLAATAEELGCEVVGPVYALGAESTDIAEHGDVDVAIVDVMLANGRSDEVIRALRERGIPVIISSGLMNDDVKDEHPDTYVIGKPCSVDELRYSLSRLLLSPAS